MEQITRPVSALNTLEIELANVPAVLASPENVHIRVLNTEPFNLLKTLAKQLPSRPQVLLVRRVKLTTPRKVDPSLLDTAWAPTTALVKSPLNPLPVLINRGHILRTEEQTLPFPF